MFMTALALLFLVKLFLKTNFYAPQLKTFCFYWLRFEIRLNFKFTCTSSSFLPTHKLALMMR